MQNLSNTLHYNCQSWKKGQRWILVNQKETNYRWKVCSLLYLWETNSCAIRNIWCCGKSYKSFIKSELNVRQFFRPSLLLKWTKSKTWHLRFIKATVTLILTILDVEAIAWYFLIKILETFQFLVKWDMKLCKYRISILVRIDLMIYDAILEL